MAAYTNGHAVLGAADVQSVDLGDVPLPVTIAVVINGRTLQAWHVDSAPRSILAQRLDLVNDSVREQTRRRQDDPDASVNFIWETWVTRTLCLFIPGLLEAECESLSEAARANLLSVLGFTKTTTATPADTEPTDA
jgi:hypothetical protein